MRTIFLVLATSAIVFTTGTGHVAAHDYRYCIQGEEFPGGAVIEFLAEEARWYEVSVSTVPTTLTSEIASTNASKRGAPTDTSHLELGSVKISRSPACKAAQTSMSKRVALSARGSDLSS